MREPTSVRLGPLLVQTLVRYGRYGAFAAALGLSLAATENKFTLFVSNERDGTVSVIDGSSLEIVRTIAVGKRPRGLHLSPDGATLYVATSGSPRLGPGADPERAKSMAADKSADGIAMIDLNTPERKRTLKVGSDPEEFALSRDGSRVIVANEDTATASIWEIATGRRLSSTLVSEEPEGTSVHPTRNEVYVACEEEGDVYILGSDTGTAITHLRLGGRPRTITFSPDGARAYVPLEAGGAIVVLDAIRHEVLDAIVLPRPALPMGGAISADGRLLYISTGRANSVVVVDLTTRAIIATIPVGTRPWGITLSPDGSRLFTANGGSDDISVIDTRARRELRRVSAGKGPWGLAIGRAAIPRLKGE